VVLGETSGLVKHVDQIKQDNPKIFETLLRYWTQTLFIFTIFLKAGGTRKFENQLHLLFVLKNREQTDKTITRVPHVGALYARRMSRSIN